MERHPKTITRRILVTIILQIGVNANNEPQPPTTSHNKPQWATTTHNKPQRATTHPQLRHEMNKTHKNLHSLVNALSPFSPLTAGILMKIVFTLSPSGFCYSYNVQALFCLWWKKFGSVFVRVILRTWQLNGEKSKCKFAAKSFVCV